MKKEKKHEFTIGQEVYVMQQYRKEGLLAANITAVGRVWVSLNYRRYRFNKQTMLLDTNITHGKVYLSIEEYETNKEIARRWQAMRSKINMMSIPGWIAIDDIDKVESILKIVQKPLLNNAS